MQDVANDMTPADAAQLLAWLAECGADEIILDAPQDRFLERASKSAETTGTPVERRPVQGAAIRTQIAAPGNGQIGTVEDAARIAAACESTADLAAQFKAFDVQGLRKSAVQFCFLEEANGARVLVLGDRPRTEEEQSGGVFAGATAVLLAAMLKAIGLAMPESAAGEAVSLANIVPWRPPGNRNPTDIEVDLCLPFVRRMAELSRPSLILAFGALPARALSGGGASVAQQRGSWHDVTCDGLDIPLLATFHPHELLNYPERKKLAWRDLLMFRERLDAL